MACWKLLISVSIVLPLFVLPFSGGYYTRADLNAIASNVIVKQGLYCGLAM